ncbi:MAG TPA: penicillin acylase family protein [Candidatus Eisenbacteria bacterium]|nr:penicillin acylase family protein [Candidatus Eisenbacteria bacterium]
MRTGFFALLLFLAVSPPVLAADRDTVLSISALQRPVSLTTDLYGTPHLRASNLSDLYFAWGFVTARDRLWQMEHGRRAASGTLWQWFGNRSLRADGGAQLFELATRARRAWNQDRSDPGVRLALERYAEGVNAYLDLCRKGVRPWPAEFIKLGQRPLDWNAHDTYLFLLAQGVLLDLTVPEIAEAETLRARGPSWFERRRRFETEWMFSTIPDSVAVRLYGRPSRRRLPGGASPEGTSTGWRPTRLPFETARDPELGASNVFAVGPARSATRAPLLANDVHLSLTAPGAFHAVHVTVPDTLDAAGGCVPGLPIIVSGRNRDAAWGITSLGADVLDVYADTLSADGRSVRWRGNWTPIREEDYTMRFRAVGIPLPTFGQKRRYTPHGPVLVYDRKRRLALSMRWTALEGNSTLRRLIGLERSRTTAEIGARVRTIVTPTLNVMAADRQGHVLYQTVGAVPRRRFDPGYGVLPSDGRHEWTGIIPADSMPAWDVPRAGFAANGNNLPIGSPYPDDLPRFDWIHDRAARMSARLAGDPEITVDDMRSIQNDVVSRAAQRLVPRLLRCADAMTSARSDTVRAALDTLRAWDGACRRDRIAPTIFRAWFGTFLRRSNLADAPGLAVAALDGRAPDALRDPRTGAAEAAPRAAFEALVQALRELKLKLGPDLSTWTWHRAHRARFAHALAWRDSSLTPPTIAIDGDNSTPCVGPSRLPGDVHVVFGPSWRHVVDLAADSSWAVIPPGNTGSPDHQRDQLQRWASHRYVPLHLDPARVAAVKESQWRLEPAR